MTTRLAGAKEVLLIGNLNQLPFIDGLNFFKMQYVRPNLMATVTNKLLCTYRNPIDVVYALNEIYSGIYSSMTQAQSLRLKRYSNANILKDLPSTLYLTYT
ncbi:hypothetical protein EVAR_41803_1 [Eumeta japonica]|uniref:(+)RNA virus helicase C-terminal domain-containing protein n=1 Tax=Eumeta variegata TaxID=151549 RepID=A0A4C1VXF6_EUMVA|nr:hypothetical protein EVAR_41803_1 [Eumeta japonica]